MLHAPRSPIAAVLALGLCVGVGLILDPAPAQAWPGRAVTELEMEEQVLASLPGILADLGLDPARVDRVFVGVTTVTDWDIVEDARTWVWFTGLDGALVVHQTAGGYLKQVYTTDGLVLPGLPAW